MNKLLEMYHSYNRSTQLKIGLGLSLMLIGFVLAIWWLMSPRYQPLFSQLRDADAAEVVKSLDELKIPYRFTDGGSGIEVPADKVYDARMKLVSAGVPSGGHVGFELFNSTDFGATEFAQRINYQRAVQGELERSIATLPGVDNVRVHVTIRKKGLFITQNDMSKASVTIAMKVGEQLSSRQVTGIRNLVASAIEGLSPSAVVVLGPNGVMAGGGLSSEEGVSTAMSEDQMSYEMRVRDRITDLLSLAMKADTFRVSVDARLNLDRVKTVSEKIIPKSEDGSGYLAKKRINRSGNIEPADGEKTTQSQEDYEYVYGKVQEEVSHAPGDIEHLSVAVIVPDTLGNVEIEEIKKLVIAAAGLDFERGDRIEISTIASVLGGKNANTANIDKSKADSAEPQQWWSLNILLIALASFVFGVLLMLFRRPKVKQLTTEEHFAMREKLKIWLAEGEQRL